MKRKSLVISIVLSALVAAIAVSISKGARAVEVTINVKDLPEHGLHIIGPSDSSFDGMMAKVIRNEPAAVVEALRPYSFFLRNAGGKHVVAYKIRWECTKPNGTVIYKDSSKSSAWIFTDESGADLERVLPRDDSIIKPNTTWFFSLGAAPRELDDSSGTVEQDSWSAVIKGENTQGQAPPPDKTKALRFVTAELSTYTSITIILDGVFFEDGTFVGPDATGFFDAVKSEIDAKFDLLAELGKAASQAKSGDEIFKHIEEEADGPEVDLGPNSTPADYYRFHKKRFSQELVAQKTALGSAQTFKQATKRLEKPWPKLRKQ